MFAHQNLSLKGKALRALAAREHSRVELEKKLAPFEETAGQLAAVLDDLTSKGLLDEQRAADSLARRRGQKLGAARVVQEMRARGVAPHAIDAAAASLRASELERAQEIWRKKFGQAAQTPAERAKQARFLISRGFAGDVVKRVVSGLKDEDWAPCDG